MEKLSVLKLLQICKEYSINIYSSVDNKRCVEIKDRINLNEMINKLITPPEEYKKILFDIFQDYNTLQNEIIDMISNIDYINSGAKVASKYNYCKPIIKENSKSFIVTKKMRHPIIERINTNNCGFY